MRRLRLSACLTAAAALCLGTAFPARALAGQSAARQTEKSSHLPNTLAAMRDHYRVLLVFTGGNARMAEKQMTVVADHADGFRNRDMLVAGVEPSDPRLPAVLLSPGDDQSARRRFHIQEGRFTAILIGKDGGEKLRSHDPVSWETLQKTIDSMPMRQQEIRNRH